MKAQTYQNSIDMVLQEYGSADALVSFCKLNNIAIDAELEVGTEYKIGEVVRRSVRDYLRERRKSVVTGRDADAGLPMPLILSEDGLFYLADEETGAAIIQE